MGIRKSALKLASILKSPFYSLYEKRLAGSIDLDTIPDHIGIILDGNRRYAKQTGLESVIEGHAHGADKLDEVLGWCYDFNIPVVTIWIFSLDNFHRDDEEVTELLELIEARIRELPDYPQIHKNKVKVRFIGRLPLLPDSMRNAIEQAEQATAKYDSFQLNVAIAYGGREEITDACRQYMQVEIDKGTDVTTALEKLEPEALDEFVYTSGLPDPSLIIRTSGEVRLSGFLLWQSAYSEFYFCDTYWPGFRKVDFLRALRDYRNRVRRFGR
jgi:short-chain Z-isoprenyl diphosphate synthase